MSQSRREQARQRILEVLNFDPPEDIPCTQVLGIGLTEDVCENDESLRRWLVCQSVEFVVDDEMDVGDAIARAFDAADEQCEFFDLDRPEQRRTDFGPLEAQRVREEEEPEDVVEQATLPGTEPDVDEEPPTLEPQRVEGPPDRGQQTGLGGGPTREESAQATEEARRRQERQERQAEQDRPRGQERLGGSDQPARISEFEQSIRPDRECDGFGPEFTDLVPSVLERDELCGPQGSTWVVTNRAREANEVSLTKAADTDEVRGFTDIQIGEAIRDGDWLLVSRDSWRLDFFNPDAGAVTWTQPRTGDQILLREEEAVDAGATPRGQVQSEMEDGRWNVRLPEGGTNTYDDLGPAARRAFELMKDDDPDPISVEDVEEAARGRPDRRTFTLRGMVSDLDFSQDVIGMTFEVSEPGRMPTTRELPNSVGTWERVGSIDQLQWRSQNANGYDVLWVEELPGERGGGRPFMLFVGTVPRQGADPDDVTIVSRNLAFIPLVNGVQDYLDANRDGRGGSGNPGPRR